MDIANKHAILVFNEQVDKYKIIETCKLYPQFDDKNISIINLINKEEIKISTYERGVGFTSSCGTGSVASALYLKHLGLIDNSVEVHNDLDTLNIKLEPEVKLSGKVHFIFEVEYVF